MTHTDTPAIIGRHTARLLSLPIAEFHAEMADVYESMKLLERREALQREHLAMYQKGGVFYPWQEPAYIHRRIEVLEATSHRLKRWACKLVTLKYQTL